MQVLIPTVASHPAIGLTLESFRVTSPEVDILLVAGMSPEPDLQDLCLRYSSEVLWLGENRGFAGNVNAGIEHLGTDQDIILANDDIVMLYPNWERRVQRHFAGREKVAAVGPCSNVGWPHQLYRESPTEHDCNVLSFFWVALRAEALQDVGLLDEQFGIGLCEDVDWCIRAKKKGWTLVVDRSMTVWHWGSQTIRRLTDDYEGLDKQNRGLLQQKHPDLDLQS